MSVRTIAKFKVIKTANIITCERLESCYEILDIIQEHEVSKREDKVTM